VSEGYTNLYDHVKCVNDKPDEYKYGNLIPMVICTGDAVFGRFKPDFLPNTKLKYRNYSEEAAKYVDYEVCQAESLTQITNEATPLLAFRKIWTAPGCPFEEGWGFAMQNRKNSSGPYYFVRVPVEQFETINNQVVRGKFSGNFAATPQIADNGTYTVGWKINVYDQKKADVHVYCKYVADAFPDVRR